MDRILTSLSYVYHMDRYCALLLGRPLGISDKFCDVEPPSNLDDSGVEQPLTRVTLNSFLVFRHSLSMIMSRVCDEAFALKEPAYTTISDIDADLRAWAASLPAGLRLRKYGQVDEDVAAHPALATHRYLLSTEYNFVQISMHRPYLARVDPEGKYKSSREACLQAAMDDLWARTTFPLPGLENLSTGSYRVTNSLVILGYVRVPTTLNWQDIHATGSAARDTPGDTTVSFQLHRLATRKQQPSRCHKDQGGRHG